MKKIIKILVILSSLLVLIGVIASIVLHLLFPPEKVKALVVKQLSTHLKREVEVGPVSLGLLSGLSISDLKVSESPTFSKGTFVSSERLSLHLALWPLLFKQIEVRELVLVRPVVTIVRYPDGKTFNFSDLLSSPSAGSSAPSTPLKTTSLFSVPEADAATQPPASHKPAAEMPFTLLISYAQIQQGIVNFIDRSPAKQSVDIDPLNLKLKNLSLTSPFRIDTSLTARSKGVAVSLVLNGQVDLPTGSLSIKTCSLSSAGSTLILAGSAEHLKSSQPTVDLQLDLKEFNLSTVTPFVKLPPELKMNGAVLGNAAVKGNGQKMTISLSLDLTKPQVAYGKLFSKPSAVPLGFSFKGMLNNLQDLQIDNLKAMLGSLLLSGHGRVQGIANSQPQITIHLETNTFPVMETAGFLGVSLPKDLLVKGKVQASGDISGTLASSQIALKLEGKDLDLAKPDVFSKSAGVPLDLGLIGEWVQAGPIFNAQTLKATLGTLQVVGNGSYHLGTVPQFSMSLKTNLLSLKEVSSYVAVLKPYQPTGQAIVDLRASGTAAAPLLNGSLTLKGAGAHYQQAELSQLNGAATFTHQDLALPRLTGKLQGADFFLKLIGHRLTTQPDINLEGNFAVLDLDRLLPPLDTKSTVQWPGEWVGVAYAAGPSTRSIPPMKLSGRLTIGQIKQASYQAEKFACDWNLTGVTVDLTHISGLAHFTQGAGMAQNIEKLAMRFKGIGLALFPLLVYEKLEASGALQSAGLPSMPHITFSGIRGDYQFTNGVMDIHPFDLVGRDIEFHATGTVGIGEADPPLNLHLVTTFAKGSIRGTVGQLLQDENGRPSLAGYVAGTKAHPAWKPDLANVTHNAVQLGIKEGMKAILGSQNDQNGQDRTQGQSLDDVKKKVLDNLGNIFGH